MLKPLDYDKLQMRLLYKAKRNIFPIKAMFELTYKCNLRCRHCYVADEENKKELSTPEVFSILKELASAGCLNLGFTGGEPFLRQDIFDILEYAKRLGFNIIILTNATLITPQKAERLGKIGLNKMDVSFHTVDEKSFDWFTQVPGTYRKVLRAVKLLREKKVEVYFKTTAITINKNDAVKLRRLATEKFGAHFRLAPIIGPRWGGRKDNLKFRLLPEEINPLMKQLLNDSEIEFEKLDSLEKESRKNPKKLKRLKAKIGHRRLFSCGAGRTEVVINPYGEMKLCIDIPEPKYQILKGSFAEGWKVLSDYVRRTAPGPAYQCRGCELLPYCGWCPAKGWLECGDLNACPPYYKELARLLKIDVQQLEVRGDRD